MNPLTQSIFAKIAATHLLNDCKWTEHEGRDFKHQDSVYYYTPSKQSNGRFNDIKKNHKIVTLRKNANGTVNALTVIVNEVTIVTATQGEVRGQITQVEHFNDKYHAAVEYPEIFAKNGNWKRANIVGL
ncbi:hypothetical protein [Vibrio rarus]|uniref:hypothetical protein n=1 Tax=Vibrio rarus TaxID=413403 RepID=UPI0021C49A3D|nr:hypothetical protein [Vibrio rarus]